MADIRINALATTAASTASDDFVAVDGSANGTRKLNAYSPTFGGNLTVSGAGNSSIAGNLLFNTSTARGILTINKTASDTLSTANAAAFIGQPDNLEAGLLMQQTASTPYSFVLQGRSPSGTYQFPISLNPQGGNVLIGTTTDGGQKLQVSGTATFKNFTGATGILVNSDNTSATNYPVVQLMHSNPAGYGGRMAVDQNGFTVFQYQYNGGAWTDWLTLNSSTGNATFGGNIKTAAPSGGTAATWRLGTVASVSPTSPNRTIEVEIGGTTYYLHAKTTND